MELSIVIVNWNSVDYLRACLASVLRETGATVAFEIIVIDAASYDGSAEMVAASFPGVRFVQATHNAGFGASNNAAVRLARGAHLLFLNPDTEIVGRTIERLHRALTELPDAGAVGCRLLNSDGSVQTSCVQSYPTVLNQLLDSEFLRRHWPLARLWGTGALQAAGAAPQRVEAIAGACLMMKRSVFDRVGGFNPAYFMYAEDIELCHRAQSLGLRNYVIPDATLVHHGGGSSQVAPSDFAVVLMRESICRYIGHTHGRLHAALYRLAMTTAAVTRLTLLWAVHHGVGNHDATASTHKWKAVLRWAVQREATVRRFMPDAAAAANP